jgi:hypothetical protein
MMASTWNWDSRSMLLTFGWKAALPVLINASVAALALLAPDRFTRPVPDVPRSAQAYERHQDPLLVKEALLVAFFLAGLVVLGGLQRWWLQPIVSALEPRALLLCALGLRPPSTTPR